MILPKTAIMVGDEVGRNDVMDGEAINRMNLYTLWTNNVNKNSYYGICWVLLIVNCMQYCSLFYFRDGIGGSGGCTLMVGASIAIHCLALCTDVPGLQCKSLAVAS